MRLAIVASAWAVVVCLGPPAWAEDGATAVDDLLGEGWQLYSEDLDFERAAEVFTEAAAAPGATEAQRLEALEYLAACRHALEDLEGARAAIRRLLEIDREGTLHDPSHPPDLLAMVDEVRAQMGGDASGEPPGLEPEVPPEPFRPPVEEGSEGESGLEGGSTTSLQDYYEDRPRTPWYRTWWFWTITGVVVAAGVTTAVVLSVPSGEAEPPAGSLEPGVVQLPCAGIPF